jgi:hypothetical protein
MPIEEEPVRKRPDDLFSLFLRHPPLLLFKLAAHDCTGVHLIVEHESINKGLREIASDHTTAVGLHAWVKYDQPGVELVMRLPVFSQSGVLAYFPYELDHPRPINRPNRIVPVSYVQRRVIRDLLLWLYMSG